MPIPYNAYAVLRSRFDRNGLISTTVCGFSVRHWISILCGSRTVCLLVTSVVYGWTVRCAESVNVHERCWLYESVGAAAQCHELFGRLEDSTSTAERRHHRHLICNSEQRVQHLLVSRGPVVRLWLDHASSQRRFLIHYSGNHTDTPVAHCTRVL